MPIPSVCATVGYVCATGMLAGNALSGGIEHPITTLLTKLDA